jgi:hypothetical protein
MALWAVAWLGSTPIGGPIVGWVGQHLGARYGLVIGGAAALVCGLAALPALSRIDRRAAADAAAAEAEAVAPGGPPPPDRPAAGNRLEPVA